MSKTKAMLMACLLLIPAALVYSEAPQEAKKEGSKAVLITAASAKFMPVERSVSVVGELQAEVQAVIKSEVKGKVVAVYKNLGDYVSSGDLIARLDSEEYKIFSEQASQGLKEAMSRYDLAILNWDRADSLFKKGLISARERDEASESLKGLDAAVKERHAAFNLAEKKLRDTSIVAPFSGSIRERFVNQGDYIEEKGTIATMVAISPLKLRATVPESAASVVKRGLKVYINVEAYPKRVFEGSLIRISPVVDP
ncbi:MAG: efflux RND transporter periplasmic adaptor subunit, partial [Deltaproteobacteria bacterium]